MLFGTTPPASITYTDSGRFTINPFTYLPRAPPPLTFNALLRPRGELNSELKGRLSAKSR